MKWEHLRQWWWDTVMERQKNDEEKCVAAAEADLAEATGETAQDGVVRRPLTADLLTCLFYVAANEELRVR